MEAGSIGKGVLFCFAFLGVFALLLGYMPSEYYYVENKPDYDQRTIPSYWSPADIQNIRWNYSVAVTDVDYYSYVELERVGSDWGDTIYIKIHWDTSAEQFKFYHWNWGITFFGWATGSGFIEPYPITEAQILDSNHLDPDGNSSRFDMNCDHHSYITHFIFNATAYGNLTHALTEHDVVVNVGMGWEYESGALSGWDIITRLLFFQDIPQLGDPLLTKIIALPLWGAIGFIVFILITLIVEMLPFT